MRKCHSISRTTPTVVFGSVAHLGGRSAQHPKCTVQPEVTLRPKQDLSLKYLLDAYYTETKEGAISARELYS